MSLGARIGRRLGGPGARRRRHRRVGIAAIVLLAVAGVLILAGRDDDDFDDRAGEVCAGFAERVQNEFRLSFPEGVPNDAAFAEYLSHAFADTMDELVVELTALDPPGDVTSIIDGYRDLLASIRERPVDFVADNPFADLAAQFDAAGLEPCGTAFFPASQAAGGEG